MRGYFGIGVEGASKPMNVGSLFRAAHGFGASFVFTIDAQYPRRETQRSDTSHADFQVPVYEFASVGELRLPRECRLVGIELAEGAGALPSFRHPRRAAYVLGPERGSLSPALVALCDHLVKIPTLFAINLAMAGAIVMYDRQLSMGRFAERPVAAGTAPPPAPVAVHGAPLVRSRRRAASGGG
jgi:tRNA G18 (ribose-2'-O)-methylase SpoU